MNENGNNIFPENNPIPETNGEPVQDNPPEAAAPAQNDVQEAPSQDYSPYRPEYQAQPQPESNPYVQNPYNQFNPYSAPNAGQPNFNNAAQAPSYSPAPEQPFPVNEPAKDKKKKKSNKGFVAFIVIAIVVVVLAVGACIYLVLNAPPADNSVTPTTPETSTNDDNTQLIITDTPDLPEGSDSLSTIEIAENAERINVGIMIYEKGQSFFANSSTSLASSGSGIVMSIDDSGKYTYILTCAHVISDAASSNYTITVQDVRGNTYDGIMVGFDEKTDIGVIKIETTSLPVAEFGNSSNLRKGQKVYAIGNPGGMDFFGSFSDGMISAIDRPISSEGGYEMKCIQHTTPINSGNSGGALLNELGQVIGINSSKIVSTGYEGMAFAIPISDAKPVIDDIIRNGRVTNRPKLGITYAPAMQYQEFAMIVNLNDLPAGSLVIFDINPDSSLANSRATTYDIITAVNGTDLDTPDVLLDKIDNGNVGDRLTLTLCRVADDYSVTEFEVVVTLVEDSGSGSSSNQQNSQSGNYWDDYFGN